MRDLLKILGIFFFGLLTAVVIYPILHEGGHSLVALAVGADVVEFNIFPVPNIMCNVFGLSDLKVSVIGLGGIFLPYLISFLLRPKNFWVWYTNSLVRGISLLALAISFVSIILWLTGITVQNEDLVQVLNIFNGGSIPLLVLFAVMFICGVMQIIADQPLKRISKYFC